LAVAKSTKLPGIEIQSSSSESNGRYGPDADYASDWQRLSKTDRALRATNITITQHHARVGLYEPDATVLDNSEVESGDLTTCPGFV